LISAKTEERIPRRDTNELERPPGKVRVGLPDQKWRGPEKRGEERYKPKRDKKGKVA